MNTQIQTQTQTVWKRIKVPENIRFYFKERAQSRGMAIWQYLLTAVNFYEESLRNVKVSDATKLQNVAWYATKLTASVTEYIHKPNEENYNKVLKIISQIETRKGINLEDLKVLVEMYKQRRKRSLARAMLQTCTRAYAEIVVKEFGE